MKNDTIAAIATALSNSGISIIRISGDDAIEITNKIFQSPSGKKLNEYASNTINYGHIIDNGEIIDEVMISIMRAPNSYTRENIVEINTHGGIYITKKVLSLVIKNGARLAEPGEFSKRAFLNGRIDLSKAEAIMDIINAESDIALKSGIKQLNGNLYNRIIDLRKKLIYEIAFIESAIDDPEHISLDGYYDKLKDIVYEVEKELTTLSNSFDSGKIIKEGISTVIVGKPNAGKSSLMNSLLGEERAIVTDIEGTTRDSLEESIKLKNIVLKLIDTAGIRNTEDTVEKIGVKRSVKYVEEANLVLYVVDSSRLMDENDNEIIKLTVGKKIIIVLNKIDLPAYTAEDEIIEKLEKLGHCKDDISVVYISAKENKGIDDLVNTIENLFLSGDIDNSNEILITNMRHKEAIDKAIDSIFMVKNSIDNQMPEDFLTIDLMNVYSLLGSVIGEEVDDDLVTEIFSKFCMGK